MPELVEASRNMDIEVPLKKFSLSDLCDYLSLNQELLLVNALA